MRGEGGVGVREGWEGGRVGVSEGGRDGGREGGRERGRVPLESTALGPLVCCLQ